MSSLRFASQLCIDNLPDEQLNNEFEVIMPALDIDPKSERTYLFGQGLFSYQPIVEEIIFGFKNFLIDTRRIRTGWFGVPKDIEQFHQAKITMFCSAAMETQYYLDAWRRLIFNEEGEYYYTFSNYKKNIEIYFYGPGGNAGNLLGLQKCHITLQGCFPYNEKDWEFEYTDDPKRFRILAMFNVDNVVVDTSVARRAMYEERLTSPTSLLDIALSQSSSSTYSIGETYGGLTNGKNPLQKIADEIYSKR